MEGFQKDLQAAARAASLGQTETPVSGPASGLFNFMAPGPSMQQQTRKLPAGLEKFSPEQLLKFAEQMENGEYPPELQQIFGSQTATVGPDGKPIVDAEGGAVVQPEKAFVVKTKEVKSGGKIFVNMTSHEFVDPFQEKYIPEQDRAAHGSDRGLRIPLSLGEQREERDKKGEPALVWDVIWAPETVKKAQTDPAFRQAIVELAFTYIAQKHGLELSLRFTIPKMKYKGATVQFQRIKAKKAPKIQEVELTDAERAEFERKGLEGQKIKEIISEITPEWHFYCDIKGDHRFLSKSYWMALISEKFEQEVGDEQDRWETLKSNLRLNEEQDVFEEYDGLNHEMAKQFILVVTLPLLVRGHAVTVKALEDIVSLRVPNLYKLQLGLPRKIEADSASAFFDCKVRKLFLVVPVAEPKTFEVDEEVQLTVLNEPKTEIKVEKVRDEPA